MCASVIKPKTVPVVMRYAFIGAFCGRCRLMNHMKRHLAPTIVAAALAAMANYAFGLNIGLPQPQIFFPQGYDTDRANQVLSAPKLH